MIEPIRAPQSASLGERRSRRLDLRLTPTDEVLIRQAAVVRRSSVTEFLVAAALAASDRAIGRTGASC